MEKYTVLIAFAFFISALIGCTEQELSPSKPLPESHGELKKMLEEGQGTKTTFEVYAKLAKSYSVTDQEQALYYLELQKDLARKVDDHHQLGLGYIREANLYRKNKDYAKSEHAYIQCIHAFEKSGSYEYVATAYNNIGYLFNEVGNYGHAIEYHLKAKEGYLAQNDLSRLALVNYNLGMCHFSKPKPDYELAESYLMEALVCIDQLDGNQDLYNNKIYNHIGAINYRLGNYIVAIENYKKSIENIGNTNSNFGLKAIASMNMAETFTAMGNFEEASHWVKEAHQFSESLDEMNQVEFYNIRAEFYQKQGQYGLAKADIETAIALADQGIINKPLQRTIELAKKWNAAQIQLRQVRAASGINVEGLENTQNKLEKAFEESTKDKNMAMLKTIEADKANKNAKASTNMMVYLIIGLALVFLGSATAIYYFAYLRPKKFNDQYKEMQSQYKELEFQHKQLKDIFASQEEDLKNIIQRGLK